MMVMAETRMTNKPVPPAGKRRGVTMRRTLVQVRIVSPTTREMQATGSLKIALWTPMMSLVTMAGVPQKQYSTWKKFIAGYCRLCIRQQRLCAPVM